MKKHFDKFTMIIEIDVSHVASDSLTSSFAAMTMSLDTYCSRYVAAVQINEQRMKLIASHIIADMMTSMFNHWFQNIDNSNLSQHVIYFRDDVSAAQYVNMLDAQYVNMLAFEIVSLKSLLYQLSKHNLNYKISAQNSIIEANLTWCKCILNRIRVSQLSIYCKLFSLCRWYWHHKIALTKRCCNYYLIQIRFATQWITIVCDWFRYLMFSDKENSSHFLSHLFLHSNCTHDDIIRIDRSVVTNCDLKVTVIRICLSNDRSSMSSSNLFTRLLQFLLQIIDTNFRRSKTHTTLSFHLSHNIRRLNSIEYIWIQNLFFMIVDDWLMHDDEEE